MQTDVLPDDVTRLRGVVVWAPSCPRGPTWTEQGATGAGRERVEQDTEGAGQGAPGVPAVGDGWRGQGAQTDTHAAHPTGGSMVGID